MRFTRASTLCLLVLAALPFAAFARIALGGAVFADGDLFSYNYPLLHETARQWKAGEVPLWNPYIFGGTPLLAQMQSGAFYPGNVLFLLLPEWLAFGETILLHYSLCGVFAFLYLRSLRLADAACMVGALVFMCSGFAMSHLGHVSTVRTLPWLPLVLCALEGWRRAGSGRWLALGAAAVGLMLLAGHPQIPLYALMVVVAYTLWFALTGEPSERRRCLVGGAFVTGLGAALAAVQLVPAAFAVGEYMRPERGSYEYFANYSLHPIRLVNLFLPELLPGDLPELAGYVGISTLFLASLGALLTGARAHPQRRHGLFFSGLAGISLVLVLGKHTPLHALMFRVPLYNLFTVPARNWYEFTLAAGVLAAFGLNALLLPDGTARLRRLRGPLIGLSCGALAAVAVALFVLRRWPAILAEEGGDLVSITLDSPELMGRLAIFAATLVVLGLGLRATGRAARLALEVLLPAILAIDLLSFGTNIYDQYEPAVLTEPPSTLDFFKNPDEPFRILGLEVPEGLEQQKEILFRDYNAVVGVESINGFDSLMLGQIDRASGGSMPTYGLIGGADAYDTPNFRRFMDLLNARFVLLPAQKPHRLEPPRYREVLRTPLVAVYENREALPRLFLVPEAVAVSADAAAAAFASGQVGGRPFDLRTLALVEAPPLGWNVGLALVKRPREGQGATARVTLLGMGPAEVRAVVESETPGVLVHSANYSAGWRAWVDEAEVPMYRVDGLVQGIVLRPGRHALRLRYEPASFLEGAAVSLLALGILLACVTVPGRLRWLAGPAVPCA